MPICCELMVVLTCFEVSDGQYVTCVYVWLGSTALRSGEDNTNQWMGVTVASQRSPLGRALVGCQSVNQFVQIAVAFF